MYALAIFLPLIGAILAGFGGRWLHDRGEPDEDDRMTHDSLHRYVRPLARHTQT